MSFHVIQLTPPGRGAVATLRVEGPGAVVAVDAEIRPRGQRPWADYPPDRLVVAGFGLPPGEEVVVRRVGPEAVELHCHGGTAAVAMLCETLAARGGVQVGWRAWLAGREGDSIAAAALEDLADARTECTAAILLDQYKGALRRSLEQLQQARAAGDRAASQRLRDQLLARAPLGMHLTAPWRVVIAGPPNAGKSSLLNALVGHSRAIVHHEPGTTRDVVTATVALDGWPVELADTAGLGPAADQVERLGVAKARERIAAADLVLWVCDGSVPAEGDSPIFVGFAAKIGTVPANRRTLAVQNKCDLPAAPGHGAGLAVSAKTGEGLAALEAAIVAQLVPDPPSPGDAVPFRTEHLAEICEADDGA